MIFLDTSLLSVVLRRQQSGSARSRDADALRRMIASGVPPSVPGIVIQEILSGVKTEAQFQALSHALERLPVLLAKASDHLFAAALFNTCQRKGVAATLVDCLIAAQAISHHAKLWTLDRDFAQIARHSELRLFTIEDLSEKP